MNTDELIRAALRRQAERAPDAAPVLAALRRAQAPRSSRGTLIAAGAALVAAFAIALSFSVQDPGPAAPAAAPTLPPSSPELTQARTPPVLFHYQPGWLPDGFVETERAFTMLMPAPPPTQRTWSLPGTSATLTLAVDHHAVDVVPAVEASLAQTTSDQVDVNGRTGYVTGDGPDSASVVWLTSGGDEITVSVEYQQARTVALRAARSVTDTGTGTLTPQLRFGWLPETTTRVRTSVTGTSPGEARCTIVAQHKIDGQEVGTVDASVARRPLTPGPNAHPVAVGDRQAVYESQDARTATLTVDQGNGQWLVVRETVAVPGQHRLSEPELIELAASISIDNAADVSWLGQR